MKINILIVDDDPQDIFFLKKTISDAKAGFTNYEFEIYEAVTPEEAKLHYEKHSINVAILDENLLGKSGSSLARDFKDSANFLLSNNLSEDILSLRRVMKSQIIGGFSKPKEIYFCKIMGEFRDRFSAADFKDPAKGELFQANMEALCEQVSEFGENLLFNIIHGFNLFTLQKQRYESMESKLDLNYACGIISQKMQVSKSSAIQFITETTASTGETEKKVAEEIIKKFLNSNSQEKTPGVVIGIGIMAYSLIKNKPIDTVMKLYDDSQKELRDEMEKTFVKAYASYLELNGLRDFETPH